MARSRQNARSGHGRAGAVSDYQLGLVRRADGFDPDADEAAVTATPHPLQLANPDHDIVVCEAGCNGPARRHRLHAEAEVRQVE